ncbi:MAG: hypothetical protein MUE44_24120 [Oscillatoriaceae cyanobacterium Prado104]|jgi:hypothetical protein|nr:hypothetical protein [Oscillatoriaceae cyanobacterium Prado104]
MPEPPATTKPPDPASSFRKLTDLARQITIPPTVRSVAGTQMQLDCQIQQHADPIANSIDRMANHRRARLKVEPQKAVREIFYGG